MTVLADKKAERGGPGPKGRQPKWAMPASEASVQGGGTRRGRMPEPMPSFPTSLPQYFPLLSRGYPPVAIHYAPVSESPKSERNLC